MIGSDQNEDQNMMHTPDTRNSIRAALAVLLIFSYLVINAQTPVNVTIDPDEVETLPFDQYFTLTVKDHGFSTDDLVTFFLYELPRKREAYLTVGSNNMDQILDGCVKYTAELEIVDSSVSIPLLMLLSPNRDYLIEIRKQERLTEEEIEAQKQKLLKLSEPLETVFQMKMSERGFNSTVSGGTYQSFVSDVLNTYVDHAREVLETRDMAVQGDINELITELDRQSLNKALKELAEKLNEIEPDVKSDVWGKSKGEEHVAKAMQYLLSQESVNEATIDKLPDEQPSEQDTSGTQNAGITKEQKDSLMEKTYQVKIELVDLQKRVNEKLLNELRHLKLARTYELDTKENAKAHFSLNYGGIYDFYGDKVRTFTTINFFLRPINPSVPLDAYNYSFWRSIHARTSLSFGLSDNTIADPGSDKRGIIGDRALMFGLGFRALYLLTVNTGVLIYEQDDRSPLVTNYSTKFTPYVGLSANVELKGIFGLK